MSRTISLRFSLGIVALSFVLLAAIFTPIAAWADGSDPVAEKFVTDVSGKAIAIISDKSLSRAARESAFGSLLDQHADMKNIATFCLGQFVRTPTEAQRAEYDTLFNNFVTKVYVTRLADYTNEKLQVMGSGPAKRGSMVTSQIDFTDGREPVVIKWWLFKEGDSYKVFDVNVVGVWLAQEQRSAFTSVINSHGGDFNALLEHLKTQIAEADTGQVPTNTGGGAQ